MKAQQRVPIEQAWANRAKIIRSAIRLKHSVAADNEINDTLKDELIKFEAAVQRGELPAPLDTKVIRGE
jgi:hypothetical protein